MIALKCNLPDGWKLVPLAELCEINPTKPRGFARTADAPTTFIPMEAVDEKTGAVVTPQVRPYGAVARGYTYFEEGDVIFAKITPCMQNGKTAILTGLLNGIGFGSTEFHVFRAKPGVDSRWIYHLLRTAEFRRKAEENFEGSAGQRRVPEDFLKAVHVPVIESAENRTGVIEQLDERISRLNKVRPVAEQQFEAASRFPSAMLQDFFETHDSFIGWSRVRVADAVDTKIKMFDKRTFEKSEFMYIDITSVDNTEKRITAPRVIPAKDAPSRATYFVRPGDILISTVRPNLNAVALVGTEHDGAVCSSGFCVLRFKEGFCAQYFFHHFLSPQFVTAVTALVQGAMYPAISDDDVMEFVIPSPVTFEEQTAVAARLESRFDAALRLRRAAKRQLDVLSALPAAILREFFHFGNGVHA